MKYRTIHNTAVQENSIPQDLDIKLLGRLCISNPKYELVQQGTG